MKPCAKYLRIFKANKCFANLLAGMVGADKAMQVYQDAVKVAYLSVLDSQLTRQEVYHLIGSEIKKFIESEVMINANAN